jgi:V8-like Glu-specific endopeptidase
MNRTTRNCELVLLVLTAACGPDVSARPEQGPAASRSAPAVATQTANNRGDVLFNDTIRRQLAARGVKVYGGPAPERTTVELPWIVPGYPMTLVTDPDPTTDPQRYAVQLNIRLPLVVRKNTPTPFVDPTLPGHRPEDTESCSGTFVGFDSVLTAAHCVIDWAKIGNDKTTGDDVWAKVRAYSIRARPRRNGVDFKLHGENAVQRSFWDTANWPSNSTDHFYDEDHDYAVVRLKTLPTPFIASASVGTNSSPAGLFVEMAHYPEPFVRGVRMYDSVGDINNDVDPLLTVTRDDGTSHRFRRVYPYRASAEEGSSGAGVFDFTMTSTAIGIHIAENDVPPPPFVRSAGQIRTGFPNDVLMLTPDVQANIETWRIAPL